MNKITVLLAVLALTIAGCESKSAPTKKIDDVPPPTAAKAAHPAAKAAPPAARQPGETMSGVVAETMSSGGYTYAKVKVGDEEIWAAAPEIKLAVGDTVSFAAVSPMENFESKTLERAFALIYFVPSFGPQAPAGAHAAAGPHGEAKAPAGAEATAGAEAPAKVAPVKKAPGGETVASVHEKRKELSGKVVSVRGKVVKYMPRIMKTNWLHLQDGTGETGTNDLTVTTSAEVKVGDTVLVTGTVAADKDFGAGYKYGVIVEKATIAVQ